MSYPGSTFPRRSAGAIARYRIVAFTATDGVVAQAAAATGKLAGVTDHVAATEADEPITVHAGGVKTCTFGGTAAAGDPLTSDAQGRAIVATVAGSRCIGFAAEAATIDAEADVILSLFTLATA